MSIEQRRATQLKRRKISKLQKIVKNKGAEFKRKQVILTNLRLLINSAGQLGRTELSLMTSLEDLGFSVSAIEIRNILFPDVLLGVFTFTFPEGFSISGGTYKANTEGPGGGEFQVPGKGQFPGSGLP